MALSTTYTKTETDYLLQKLQSEIASGLKGELAITDTAPTVQGLYILSDVGTYTNLGGLVATADKLNYAYFDGTTWSLVSTDANITINEVLNPYNIIENKYVFLGKYINHNNGNLIDFEAHSTTDFIPLSEDVHYSFGNYFDNSFFAFYDINKNYIADTRSANRILDFKAPAGAKYIRVSYLTANKENVYLKIVTDEHIENWGVDILKNVKFTPTFFVNQTNGGNSSASWTSVSDFIPLLEGRFYGINPNTYQQFAFYDNNLQFLSNNLSADGKKDFKVPNGAKYMRMTVNNTDIGINYLKLKNPKFADKIIEVGKEISDFSTIQDAINYANSTNQSHTIKISNGVYLEALVVLGTVSHSFIGASKTETIISDVNDDTQKWEALQVNGGYFENIFFRQKGGGYAVHCDYPKEGVIEFFNCRMETAYASAIGCGAQPNQTLKFRNCQIIQLNAPVGIGTMYWHNAVDSSVVGQRLEMWHCEIFGNERALRIDDANQIYGDGNMPLGNAKCLFVGNNFFSGWYQKELDLRNNNQTTDTTAIIGKIQIDERSFGNNITSLNK